MGHRPITACGAGSGAGIAESTEAEGAARVEPGVCRGRRSGWQRPAGRSSMATLVALFDRMPDMDRRVRRRRSWRDASPGRRIALRPLTLTLIDRLIARLARTGTTRAPPRRKSCREKPQMLTPPCRPDAGRRAHLGGDGAHGLTATCAAWASAVNLDPDCPDPRYLFRHRSGGLTPVARRWQARGPDARDCRQPLPSRFPRFRRGKCPRSYRHVPPQAGVTRMVTICTRLRNAAAGARPSPRRTTPVFWAAGTHPMSVGRGTDGHAWIRPGRACPAIPSLWASGKAGSTTTTPLTARPFSRRACGIHIEAARTDRTSADHPCP